MLAGGGAGSDVKGFGSSEVARQAQNCDASEFGIELRAFVVGAAIDHQNFDERAIVGTFESGQAAA